jgi:hypothetical protein
MPYCEIMKAACRIVLAGIALGLLASCVSSQVYEVTGSASSVPSVADVRVSADQTGWDADTIDWYRQLAMNGALRSEIVQELRRNGRMAPDGPTLVVTVTDFRLRSSAHAAMFGAFAGEDRVAARASIERGGKVLRTYEISSSTATSGIGRNSTDARTRMIARSITRKLLELL